MNEPVEVMSAEEFEIELLDAIEYQRQCESWPAGWNEERCKKARAELSARLRERDAAKKWGETKQAVYFAGSNPGKELESAMLAARKDTE